MRVTVKIETEGVVTEITREYEPALFTSSRSEDFPADLETPSLPAVAQAVARAAASAHRLN